MSSFIPSSSLLLLFVGNGKAQICAYYKGFESVAAPVVAETHFYTFEKGLVFGKRQAQALDSKQRGIAQSYTCFVAAEARKIIVRGIEFLAQAVFLIRVKIIGR